jgi:NADH-quinone oxidoreductase subunit H
MVDFLLNILFSPIVLVVIKAAAVMGALLHLAAVCTWIERKAAALIQDRQGANRASILGFDLAGIFNTLVADPVKALLKEDFVPKGTSQFMHCMGPFMAVFPVLLSFAVVPFGPPINLTGSFSGQQITLQLANLNVGILYVFAMGSLAVYGVVIAGWVANNKYSLMGGLRASAQMISYEITMGISIIGLIACYQTLDLNEIIAKQSGTVLGVLPAWGIFLNPFNVIAFVIFFISMMAETKRAPFDLPESESELVAGYLTEYSGMKFLLFWLGEFAEIVVASAIMTILFFGGWQAPYFDISTLTWGPLIGAMIFGAKVTVLCVVQIILRWTLPRFRYDQLMSLCWKIMLPISIAVLFGTVAWELLFGMGADK